jgi:hypothetical protein
MTAFSLLLAGRILLHQKVVSTLCSDHFKTLQKYAVVSIFNFPPHLLQKISHRENRK